MNYHMTLLKVALLTAPLKQKLHDLQNLVAAILGEKVMVESEVDWLCNVTNRALANKAYHLLSNILGRNKTNMKRVVSMVYKPRQRKPPACPSSWPCKATQNHATMVKWKNNLYKRSKLTWPRCRTSRLLGR